MPKRGVRHAARTPRSLAAIRWQFHLHRNPNGGPGHLVGRRHKLRGFPAYRTWNGQPTVGR